MSRSQGGVVHVIGRLNVGGPAHLVVALSRASQTTTVATGAVQAGEVEHADLDGVDLHRIAGLGRRVSAADDARALRELVRLLRAKRPDIVHTHTAKGGVLGRTAALCVPAARVHTFHGHLLYGYFGPQATRAVTTVESLYAARTDRLVTVGARVRDELLKAGIGRPDQYCVIPPGVVPPAEVPRDRARQLLQLPKDRQVVAFVGRLAPIKRPDRVLDVARLHPEALFLVVGDGSLRAELELAAPPNVRFLGWRADVGTVFSASDVVLLTSQNEGMPLSLIEAGMLGVPAVSTDVGSAGEVVLHGRTGLLCAPDVDALSAATGRLLDDAGLRHRWGRDARSWTTKRFAVAGMVQAHLELYASLR
ncbi:MAG: glycosyltransferase [Pseudorhodobacter sp.]|nr:glycosyltransferase [Frankiaceae bacterium]